MSTPASELKRSPWSHKWKYEPLDYFGDPDAHDGQEFGVVVSINAISDVEAEQRVLTYAMNNFDDAYRFLNAVATSLGPQSDGRYQVRVVLGGHQ